MKKKKKYMAPQIKFKKIKVNFFLSNFFWIDEFNMVGDVYAQSGGACGGPECGGCGGGDCATGSTC